MNGHSFGSGGRCAICDVRWHRRFDYTCMKGTSTMHPYVETPRETRKHQSSDKVLENFEHTRSQHGGVIADAAPLLGMSEAALQRCLYRAKKQGRDIRFTTSRKKAQYELRDAVSDAHEAVEETVDAANTYAQNLHI